MRTLSRLVISAAIFVSATAQVGAATLQSSVHGNSNVSIRPTTGVILASGHGVSGHGGVAPLARKMGPKGCYRNCMRGGMREDFCTLSCY